MATTYRLNLDGTEHDVVIDERGGATTVTIDGRSYNADLQRVDGPLFSLLLDGMSFEVVAQERSDASEVVIGDRSFEIEVERPGRRRAGGAAAAAGGALQLKAPLTGSVVQVPVKAGDALSAGQVVVVVESMKMNNEIRAPRDGRVVEVHVQAGDRVERNALLVTIA